MKASLSKIFGILVVLSFATIIVFNLTLNQSIKTFLILFLFAVKFLLVAFYFMELKKANSFWKVSLITFLALITLLIVSITAI